MKYQLYREQRLNCSLEKAWNFFSSPKNLSTITPADMGFVVVSSNENEPIYEGMLIEYKVSPLLKIRLKWITKITHVDFEKALLTFKKKDLINYGIIFMNL